MNINDAHKILGIIDSHYRLNPDPYEADVNANTWKNIFDNEPIEKVLAALYMYINTESKYPPVAGDVKDTMKQLERLINNGRLTVREYMGGIIYDKLPLPTRSYIERCENIKTDLIAALPDPEKKADKRTQEERDKEAAYWIGKMMALISDSEQPFIKYNKIAR